MALCGSYILVYFSMFWLCNGFDFGYDYFGYYIIIFWLFYFGYCDDGFRFSNGYVLGNCGLILVGVWLVCG